MPTEFSSTHSYHENLTEPGKGIPGVCAIYLENRGYGLEIWSGKVLEEFTDRQS